MFYFVPSCVYFRDYLIHAFDDLAFILKPEKMDDCRFFFARATSRNLIAILFRGLSC